LTNVSLTFFILISTYKQEDLYVMEIACNPIYSHGCVCSEQRLNVGKECVTYRLFDIVA